MVLLFKIKINKMIDCAIDQKIKYFSGQFNNKKILKFYYYLIKILIKFIIKYFISKKVLKTLT